MSDNGDKKKKIDPDAPVPARDIANDVINLAIILGLVVFFFADVILNGQVFFAGDVMNVYSPWQEYNQEALSAGRLPLWSDDFFAGFPLFAESQGAIFYPPTRLIYALSPRSMAFSFDVIFHFILAGWFQYFFARTLRLSPRASLLAAVTFAFSGMFLSLPINFTIFRSIVWIPFIFAFLTIGARRGSLLFPLITAFGLVCQMMGGSLQVTGITVLAMLPYVIFLIYTSSKLKKQTDLIPIAQFFLSLMIAAGLYAFQLLPTLELMLHSFRGTASYEVASSFSFPPEHLIDILMPTFYGAWADGTMLPVTATANFFPYIGLASLFLIFPALAYKRRGVAVCVILFVLFIVLALGRYGVLYPIIYKTIPFFDKFRAPDRFWIIAIFAGSLLAGFGLMAILATVESGKKLISTPVGIIIGFVLLLIAGFAFSAKMVPGIESLWNGLFGSISSLILGNRQASIDPGLIDRWKLSVAGGVFHALVTSAAFIFAISFLGKKGRGSMLAGIIVLITVLDLYGMSFNIPALRTTDKTFFTEPPRSAQVLMRDGEPNRFVSPYRVSYARSIFGFDSSERTNDAIWYNGGGSNNIEDYVLFREALTSNLFMHWKLQSADGFASLFLERWYYMESAWKQQINVFLDGAGYERAVVDDWASRDLLIDLAGADYVLTPSPLVESPRFILIDDGPMDIYRNNNAFPRAWIARPSSVLAENRGTIDQVMQGELDLTETLILNPMPQSPRQFAERPTERATARIIPVGGAQAARLRGGEIPDEQVLIEINSPTPAYLVLADTWYPGWEADIDGVKVENIYRAFGYFRAIEIPAGEHTVRFEYRPASFSTGMVLSGVTLLLAVLLIVVQLVIFQKTKPPKKADPTKW